MRRHLSPALTVALLLVSFALVLTSATHTSPTMDEQNHIARGVAYVGTGDPRLSVEHPPLVNVLSGLPVYLLLHPRLPVESIWWEAGEWYHFADLFLWEVNSNADQIVFLARLPVMGLYLLLIALVHRWATRLFGRWGGLLAAAFCTLDPNLLAHAQLATTDVGGAFFAFLAAYAVWALLRHPSPSRVVWAGLSMGLAFAAKLSALLFGPILALAAVVDGLPGPSGRAGRVLGRLGLMSLLVLMGLLVVWACYGFQVGPLEEGGLAVPAAPYLRGVRTVLGFAAGGRSGYLLGQTGTEGWWTYFLVAFVVKTPLATLVALLLATGLALRRPRSSDLFLLLPPLVYFGIMSLSSLNLGYRHLLPILPFLFVHLARLAPAATLPGPRLQAAAQRLVPLALVLGLVAATVCIYPYFLAYFNPLGGGPEGGWRVLADSNIDWGQDLERLRDWMQREGVERVRLAWFGSAHPEFYDIGYDLLPGLPYGFALWSDPPFDPQDPEPGVYAISVSNLVGAASPVPDLYAWFRAREPDARIGYSIFIYRVSAPPAQ
jgi:hypothetical protein